jgi:hypothetical protein
MSYRQRAGEREREGVAMTTTADQELADVVSAGLNDDEPYQPSLDGRTVTKGPVVKFLGIKASDVDEDEVAGWKNGQRVSFHGVGVIVHTGESLDQRDGTTRPEIHIKVESTSVELAQ